MTLHEIDPLRDPRWADLVERSEDATIFHTCEWLGALRRTYDYEPVAFTDAAPGEALRNGLVFCRVKSWMTGRRLVSLPFSDHCEPLVASCSALTEMLELLKSRHGVEGRYIELRPVRAVPTTGFQKVETYVSHAIDLRPELPEIFSAFHKRHAQRTVRRAQRLGLACDAGRSAELLTQFYALHTRTRRRHHLPAQPIAWFENLLDGMSDRATIYVATHQNRAVAAILTIVHGKTLVYKYGGSDTRYNRLGGMRLLFWRAIQRAKSLGLTQFDLGRSDVGSQGLLDFKDRLGARRTVLDYYRYGGGQKRALARWVPIAQTLQAFVPKTIQASVGSGLYKHFG